jgi:hypothetical protein
MTYIGFGGVLLAMGVAGWIVSANRRAAAKRSKLDSARRARLSRPLQADETHPEQTKRSGRRDFGRR